MAKLTGKAALAERGDRAVNITINAILVFACIMVIYPLWFVLIASFSDPRAISMGKVFLWPVDFTFDGYGNAIEPAYYAKDAEIAANVAALKGFECIDIDMVLEGGSVEVDGKGTLIAAKSCVVGSERNSGMKVKEVEKYLKKYYGVTNIIWIDGLKNEDITDGHIDACVKFANGNKLVTLPHDDFMWYCSETERDWKTVTNAVNAEGEPYEIVEIPLTETFYEELEDYGCYLNYYVGNEVVLVPVYGDVNDQLALDIIADLYPTRQVVGINCLTLSLFGGMVHCVTQQQPALD